VSIADSATRQGFGVQKWVALYIKLIYKFICATLSAMLRKRFFIFIIFLMVAMPAYAGVVINEVAWMGTVNSAQDEWIELYSDTGQSFEGWTLSTADGGMNIQLSGAISAGGYFLIERTNDDTVPGITADLIKTFGSGLGNSGDILILKDAGGVEIDNVDGSGAWSIGGSNETKETLQRSLSGWVTKFGTPKASNGWEAPLPPEQTPTPTPTPTSTLTPTPTTTPITTTTPATTPTPPTTSVIYVFPTPSPEPSAVPSLAPTPVSSPQPSSHLAPTGAPETSPIYNSANAPKAKKDPAPKATAKKEVSNTKAANVSETSVNNNAEGRANEEYFWLLGGVLGGAVLGLLCVIIAKWKKSP